MELSVSAHVPALAVSSVGMVSSGGLSAKSACAAIRAGIARFEELPFHDGRGEPIVGAPAVEAVLGRQGFHRLAPMLCLALADCMGANDADYGRILHTVPCLIVVGSADRPDYPANFGPMLLTELRATFGVRELNPLTRVVTAGVAGFFHALLHARKLLLTQESCLVVCVDSLLNRIMLQWLGIHRKLKTPDNPDGVIPGEAAAALWLTVMPGQQISQVDGVGLSREPSVMHPQQANKAIGLAQAMSDALSESGLPLDMIDFRVAGVTGERLGFMEASTAMARIQKVHKDEFLLWAPAEQIGDVGAALPACMAVAAVMGLEKGYAPGRRALIYCGFDDDVRGACVISRLGT